MEITNIAFDAILAIFLSCSGPQIIGRCFIDIHLPFSALIAEPFSQLKTFLAALLFLITRHRAHYRHSNYSQQDRQAFHFSGWKTRIFFQDFYKKTWTSHELAPRTVASENYNKLFPFPLFQFSNSMGLLKFLFLTSTPYIAKQTQPFQHFDDPLLSLTDCSTKYFNPRTLTSAEHPPFNSSQIARLTSWSVFIHLWRSLPIRIS